MFRDRKHILAQKYYPNMIGEPKKNAQLIDTILRNVTSREGVPQ